MITHDVVSGGDPLGFWTKAGGDVRAVEKRWQMWGRTEIGTGLWCEPELQTP